MHLKCYYNEYIHFFSFFFFWFFCCLFVCFYVNWANFKWCNMQILYSTSRKYLHCDGNNQNSYGEDSHYLPWRMAALWLFSSISGGKCESSRGGTDLVLFFDWCNSDIHAHLIKHHLLRESLSEKELILARAGLLEITEEQIEKNESLSSSSSWARKVVASAENLPVSKTRRKKIGDFWNTWISTQQDR